MINQKTTYTTSSEILTCVPDHHHHLRINSDNPVFIIIRSSSHSVTPRFKPEGGGNIKSITLVNVLINKFMPKNHASQMQSYLFLYSIFSIQYYFPIFLDFIR